MDLTKTKIVVTGGAGFIGSNIVRKLLEFGADVVVLDDLSTGRRVNIEPFLDDIVFFEKSITDLDVLRQAFNGVDYVLHQAAIPSVPRSISDPITSHHVNATGALNVFWIAKEMGVKRVVYACSSSAYGTPDIIPVHEGLGYNPLSPYAVQKAMKEMYGKVFSNLYGLETVGLKYFNVFGPNQDPNSKYSAVIPLFITSMLKGQSPTIFGDGSTSRDFTYVDNVVDANIRAIFAENVSGHIINVASGNPKTLNELVATINGAIETSIDPIYSDWRMGDIKHSHADIRKAKELLGFSPFVDFEQGILNTIQYLK